MHPATQREIDLGRPQRAQSGVLAQVRAEMEPARAGVHHPASVHPRYVGSDEVERAPSRVGAYGDARHHGDYHTPLYSRATLAHPHFLQGVLGRKRLTAPLHGRPRGRRLSEWREEHRFSWAWAGR